MKYEVFPLQVIHRRHHTGFEETKASGTGGGASEAPREGGRGRGRAMQDAGRAGGRDAARGGWWRALHQAVRLFATACTCLLLLRRCTQHYTVTLFHTPCSTRTPPPFHPLLVPLAQDFPIRMNDLIAGRYQVVDFLGSAAFSRAVQALDIKTNQLVCLKIVKVSTCDKALQRNGSDPISWSASGL